jgi:hypothetical protein
MTAPRDPDRLIHAFVLEGAEQLDDRVYDAVRASIDQKRQRAVIGPWRLPTMNRFVPAGLGAAAVVVALVVGIQMLPLTGGSGGAPAPTPWPTPTLSPAPSRPADGSLPIGPFILYSGVEGPRVTVTIPATGWYGDVSGGILIKNENVDPPDGAGMIWPFYGDQYVYGDACNWETTTPDAPATTVDEFVAAIWAQTPRNASAPIDVTLAGHTGKSITIHVPDDAAYAEERFADCDAGLFASWGGPGAGPDSVSRYHQGPGQIDELWILDVDGLLTVVDITYYAATPTAYVDEMRAIVGSATFE